MLYRALIYLLSLKALLVCSEYILSEKVPVNDDAEQNWFPVGDADKHRIVGGQETTIEEHPYQVSFIVNNSYFCGGFIVSENYILTAAHCAQNVDPKTVVLRAGSTWRKNGTIIPIAEVTPHPEYDNPAFDKDVAVMKTVDPMEFNERMEPIPLPKMGRQMRGGTDVVVSGWGRTKVRTSQQLCIELKKPCLGYADTCDLVFQNGPRPVRKYSNFARELADWALALTHLGACCVYVVVVAESFKQQGASSIPERLMDVRVPVVYYAECLLAYPSVLTYNMFCAGNFFYGGQGSCQGDSGGAAIQDGMAVGIVSFGRGCGQPLSPGVYADIASPTVRKFITEHTGL